MAGSDPKLKWSGDVHGVRTTDGRTFETVYREIWTVLLDASDHTSIALATSGLPLIASTSTFDSGLRVVNKQARRVSLIMAEVDVDFAGPTNGEQGNQSPTQIEAKVRGSHQDVEIGFDRDADGNKVCTPTGEPYRGLMTVKADTVFTVMRPLAVWDGATSVQFTNKVNADEFDGHAAGTVLCKGFDWEDSFANDVVYWTVTGRFIVREPDEGIEPEKTWFKRVLRQGLYCFVVKNSQYKVVRCVDGTGSPATSPMLLDYRGFQIRPDDEGEFDPDEETDVWDYFKEFKEVNFADIGFF